MSVSRVSNATAATAVAGLHMVTPTSVVVGSGTGSVSGQGAVTFSGATSVSLNGCFTANYDNYRLMFSNLTCSSTPFLRWQMVNNGTAISTSTYSHERIYAQGTSLGAASTVDGTSAPFTAVGTVVNSAALDLFCPFLAVPTKGISQGNYAAPGTPFYSEYHTSYHSTSTSYNGINFLTDGSTISGTIRIYGYNNGSA